MQPSTDSSLSMERSPSAARRWHVRLALMRAVLGFVPSHSLCRLRRIALAACGVKAGFATLFWGLPRLTGPGNVASRLRIGSNCGFNDGCDFDLEAPVRIGDHVSVGHEVRFLTSQRRDGAGRPAAITVGDGVWLGAKCTLLGGVTIGAGAVIGAGATVTQDVPPDTLFSGSRLIPLSGIAPPDDAVTEEEIEARRKARPLFLKLKDAWGVEFANFRWQLVFVMVVSRFLPEGRGTRLRGRLIRMAGPRMGTGTRILGMPIIQSSRPGSLGPRLRIGSDCLIGVRVVLEFGAPMRIGDRVNVGNDVVILTTTHQLGPSWHRAWTPTSHPVEIGDDASIGEGAIILPGVKIGARARVLPGSVVNASVPADVTVGGAPARPVRRS